MSYGNHSSESIELKYCEFCGGLYLRPAGSLSTTCRSCLRRRALEQAFDRCPVPQRGRPIAREEANSASLAGGAQ